ncbi:MAG: hypothetical protein WB822_03260 [Rhodoplanes sp.]
MADHIWTNEKLAALDLKSLKTVRINAERKGVADLIAMCDQVLASRARKPSRERASSSTPEVGEIVLEYHFVCRNDRGITFNPDGTFWSTSWVVSEELLKTSMRYGARLALHNSKIEPSYRQGIIKDYRRIGGFEDGKIESRIDFLVSPDDKCLPWAGTGTGEKGYKRARISDASRVAALEE